MRGVVIRSLILAAAFVFAAAASAQPAPARVVTAVRAAPPPAIDGRLDDSRVDRGGAGRPASCSGIPRRAQPATEETLRARRLRRPRALRRRATCATASPGPSCASSRAATPSVEADAFVVYLDPHHDHLTGAQFGVSAAGVQRDALIYNDNFLDSTWDAVWESAVAVGDGRLDRGDAHPAVAAALPEGRPLHVGHQRAARSSSGATSRTGCSWCRKNESGLASRMARLEGIAGIDPPPTLELLPYVTSRGEFIAPVAPGIAVQRRVAVLRRRPAST